MSKDENFQEEKIKDFDLKCVDGGYLLYLKTYQAGDICPECGERLKKKFIKYPDIGGEYHLVCNNCKILLSEMITDKGLDDLSENILQLKIRNSQRAMMLCQSILEEYGVKHKLSIRDNDND